jgi:hypothetical protein
MDWTKRILVYGLPALSIPLADPMMTAVDTLFVGQVKPYDTPSPIACGQQHGSERRRLLRIAPHNETHSVRSLVSPRS